MAKAPAPTAPDSEKHPSYADAALDWTIMRDTYAGERKIKEKGVEYLPATAGMVADGISNATDAGSIAYAAYKKRAVFRNLVRPAVLNLLGVMHRKAPVIKLPAKLEPMRWDATIHGESLEVLLIKLNEEQLLEGRVGLMMDIATGATVKDLPYLVTYNAETIWNWDMTRRDQGGRQRLSFVTLDETEQTRAANSTTWQNEEKRRILALSQVAKSAFGADPSLPDDVYVFAEMKAGETATAWTPVQHTGQTLDNIPFVFIGARDLVPDPDFPPLLDVANISLAVYRGEADYRQSLYMQAQETLVVIGSKIDSDQAARVGANARLDLPMGGDAKYIGVGAGGLQEMREAIGNDERRAAQAGASLVDGRGLSPESGDALRIRMGARTATLTTVATASATALEQILKQAAKLVGANPEEVSVEPNIDFTDVALTGQDIMNWMTAKSMGFPISFETMHNMVITAGLTSKTIDEERALIDEEPALDKTMFPNHTPEPEEPEAPGAVPKL